MIEVWKDINGYEGLYQSSTFGRIKRLTYSRVLKGNLLVFKERILNLTPLNHRPVLMVGLCKNAVQIRYQVHRIIAQTFIENPLNKETVNHKDGNPANNNIDNLEWCTYSENLQHAYDTGLKRKGRHHYRARLIIDTSTGVIFHGIIEAANYSGIKKNTLCKYLSGKNTNKSNFTYA